MSEISVPSYPVLEFVAVRNELAADGSRVKSEAPFLMDLRASNATLDHVIHYTQKGYRVVKMHNVDPSLLEKNESWAAIASYLASISNQVKAALKAKPIADLVEKQKAKTNG